MRDGAKIDVHVVKSVSDGVMRVVCGARGGARGGAGLCAHGVLEGGVASPRCQREGDESAGSDPTSYRARVNCPLCKRPQGKIESSTRLRGEFSAI